MRRKYCFFDYLQVWDSLCKCLCLDWPFYLFLAGHLAKFELPARTANKTCLEVYKKVFVLAYRLTGTRAALANVKGIVTVRVRVNFLFDIFLGFHKLEIQLSLFLKWLFTI